MQLAYSLQYPEWLRSQRDFLEGRLGRVVGFLRYAGTIHTGELCALWFLSHGIISAINHGFSGPAATYFLASIGFLLFSAVVAWMRRKRFKGLLMQDVQMDISENGVIVKRSNGSKGEYNWTVFLGTYESVHFFTLYLSKQLFVAIPKRAMSAGQKAEFQSTLEQHSLNHRP